MEQSKLLKFEYKIKYRTYIKMLIIHKLLIKYK